MSRAWAPDMRTFVRTPASTASVGSLAVPSTILLFGPRLSGFERRGSEQDHMIAGKRFVIAGLSRLTTRVARVLAARDAEVTVIRGSEGEELVPLLDERVRVQRAGSDRASTLRAAG